MADGLWWQILSQLYMSSCKGLHRICNYVFQYGLVTTLGYKSNPNLIFAVPQNCAAESQQQNDNFSAVQFFKIFIYKQNKAI